MMTALLLSRSSPQWLLTSMPDRRRDLPGKNVMVQIVEMDGAVIIQTSLSAVRTMTTIQIGVELLMMTALLLSRSSPQWLLTSMPDRRRDLPGKNVMVQIVEMDGAVIIQTSLSAVRTMTTTQIGVELLLMTALLLSRSF